MTPRLALIIKIPTPYDMKTSRTVVVEIKTCRAFLADWEIEPYLDAYSRIYGIKREGLTGYTVPLLEPLESQPCASVVSESSPNNSAT